MPANENEPAVSPQHLETPPHLASPLLTSLEAELPTQAGAQAATGGIERRVVLEQFTELARTAAARPLAGQWAHRSVDAPRAFPAVAVLPRRAARHLTARRRLRAVLMTTAALTGVAVLAPDLLRPFH